MQTNHPAATGPELRPKRRPGSDDAQVDYLVGLLSDDDPGSRWKAAQALGRLQNPDAVDPLLRALHDDDWRVQQKAVWALGSIGDPRAIPILRRRYLEADGGLRDLIVKAQEMIRSRMYRPD